MSMIEVLASEAVRVMAPSVAGAASGGARRLLALLTNRGERLPADPAGRVAFILRRAREDETFAAELAQELVAVDSVDAVAVVAPALFADREEVRARLAAPGVRLIGGAHGTGKTALAWQVVHDLRESINAYAVVDLDEYRDGAVLRVTEVRQEVLRQLGVPQVDDTAPIVADQYRRALRHRRFALVLDNVAGAAEAEALVHPWEHATVLVTTRVLTQDLRVWHPGRPEVLGAVDPDGAELILASRCGPEMLAAEPDAVRELIRRCDGIPSILGQAGAWLARRQGKPGAVAEMVARLRGAGEVGTLFDDSVRLSVAELDAGTAADLVTLAGHPGTDISDAGVAALLGRPADDLVDRLLDAALLVRGPHGRLSLLWSVRRHLRPAGDDAAFARYLRWFRDLAGAADLAMDPAGVTDRAREGRLRRYPAPEPAAWPFPHLRPVDWLQGEAHLVPDLLREAHHRGYHVEVLQLCGAMEALLTLRGHHWLCLEANAWGIAGAEALGLPLAAARLHALQGRIHVLLGQLDRADAELSAAESLVPDDADRQLTSSLLEFRARWAQERARLGATGELASAESMLRRAVTIDRALDDRRGLGLHLRMLANVLVEASRAGEALALLDGAAAPAGDARNAARIHLVRAKAWLSLGAAAEATGELDRARGLTTDSGATQYELELADLRGWAAHLTGDTEAARKWWGWVAYQYFLGEHPRAREFADRLSRETPGS
ncbi:NB-ARC domain-containing protein [Actinoplanes ianthinogenes]|nr:NB-ARC domain-containing protein [Actinoplanes ianthinogenes]